jgi:uncharacterized protein YuzE
MKVLNLTLDTEFQLAYAYLGSGEVSKTIEVHPTINVDLKENGEVFGVEFLSFNALEISKEALRSNNKELKDGELEAVLFAQEKVRERLAN